MKDSYENHFSNWYRFLRYLGYRNKHCEDIAYVASVKERVHNDKKQDVSSRTEIIEQGLAERTK